MGLDRVVEVDEAQQAEMAVFAILERLLLMPHLHDRTDHAFGFAVCLGPVDARELLADTELGTGFDESMIGFTLEFLAIV